MTILAFGVVKRRYIMTECKEKTLIFDEQTKNL